MDGNGVSLFKTKMYFNSTKQLREFFESCARDMSSFQDPKRSIDYWLAKVTHEDLVELGRMS